MFDKLKTIFAKPAPPSPAEAQNEARLCAVALLVEAALSDGIYANIEHARIMAIIRDSFGMDEDAAKALLDAAEERAEMAVDHYAFTRTIKAHMPKNERIAIIGHMWDVSFADGEESPFEDAMIRRVAALLAVTDHERAEAKKAALGRTKSD